MDSIKDFFEYETLKFWIALFVIIILHLIPIPLGEEDIAMILFKLMWQETKSVYFLIGMLAVEVIIIIIPFVYIQRFLSEKLHFN